jgi:hypothetical protein
VRSALTKAGIFKDLKTDVKAHTATFAVSTGVDFKKKLDAIVADGNRHVKGYEVATKKDEKKEQPKTKTVSLKLPNMT